MSDKVSLPDAPPTAASQEYRAHVGTEALYDYRSALQFNLLTTLGLREGHYLLDIGCGSLCSGRLFIPYLRPGRYFGIEPLPWLVEAGIREELGQSAIDLKKPTFRYDDTFNLEAFGQHFDFILAQSIFSHASQAQIRACLAAAAKVMKPESIFVATFFEGSTNYEGHRWIVHADYTMDRMRELVEEQGLILRRIQWDHQDLQTWIAILHGQTTVTLPMLNPTLEIAHLTTELARAREHLAKIRRQPYVRFGYKVKWLLLKIQFASRRLRRLILGR